MIPDIPDKCEDFGLIAPAELFRNHFQLFGGFVAADGQPVACLRKRIRNRLPNPAGCARDENHWFHSKNLRKMKKRRSTDHLFKQPS
jgi:hypothetical protein